MSRSLLLGIALATAALAAGPACGGSPEVASDRRTAASAEQPEPADPTAAFTADGLRAYMRQLAPLLVSRELEPGELAAIEDRRFEAVRPMLTNWTSDGSFPRAARRLYSQKLSVSGARDGIDFDLPGNLAEYVVRERLPLSAVLTADFCVDAAGAKRECDSGAPYKAGVLATRAFMASRASRFNLTRASTMMHTFVCRHYPMTDQVEPRIDRTRLITLFKSDTEVGDDGKPKATFGNGAACYTCHGQFGPHAQLFVRFDEKGMYRADASGLQDPKGELGRALGGLFASHLEKADESKDETSQMLGRPVKNLREAAAVIANDAAFVPCQAKNILEYALRLPQDTAIGEDLLEEIAAKARLAGDPTFATITVETFSHPRVIASVIAGIGSPAVETQP